MIVVWTAGSSPYSSQILDPCNLSTAWLCPLLRYECVLTIYEKCLRWVSVPQVEVPRRPWMVACRRQSQFSAVDSFPSRASSSFNSLLCNAFFISNVEPFRIFLSDVNYGWCDHLLISPLYRESSEYGGQYADVWRSSAKFDLRNYHSRCRSPSRLFYQLCILSLL